MSVFFVFIWYFIGADLPKNVAKCAGFQKGIKKREHDHMEGDLSTEGGFKSSGHYDHVSCI